MVQVGKVVQVVQEVESGNERKRRPRHRPRRNRRPGLGAVYCNHRRRADMVRGDTMAVCGRGDAMSQAERERRRQADQRRRAMQVAAARWNLAFSDQRASAASVT